jgi:hypothetical protein
MSTITEKPASRVKVHEHRARLRAQGLRPVQMWVPDVRSAAFRAEARRQSLLVAGSPTEKDDQAFGESLFDWDDLPAFEWGDAEPSA